MPSARSKARKRALDILFEAELRELVTGSQSLSVDERKIVGEVFDAGKRQIREVLVPRTEVDFLDADTPVAMAASIAVGVPHSRLPVYQDTYDNVTGFVHVRDLLGPRVHGDASECVRCLQTVRSWLQRRPSRIEDERVHGE